LPTVKEIKGVKRIHFNNNLTIEFDIIALEKGEEVESVLYVLYYGLFHVDRMEILIQNLLRRIDNDWLDDMMLFVGSRPNRTYGIGTEYPLFNSIIKSIKDNRDRFIIEASL